MDGVAARPKSSLKFTPSGITDAAHQSLGIAIEGLFRGKHGVLLLMPFRREHSHLSAVNACWTKLTIPQYTPVLTS